jgi:hypothetical protein
MSSQCSDHNRRVFAGHLDVEGFEILPTLAGTDTGVVRKAFQALRNLRK